MLELQLAQARLTFQHKGLRGGAVESAVRKFVDSNLPRSLSVATGEVIALEGDGKERVSRQIDFVVCNQMQPFQNDRDTPMPLLIEGVNVAGEIKSIVGRSSLDDEFTKARIFRSLRAKNLSGLVSVPKPDCWEAYYVHYRPYFLFSFNTSGDWRWILLRQLDFIANNKKIPFDAIFLMDKGIVILTSPFLKFPFSDAAGIPFENEITGLNHAVIGGIHIYKTSAFLCVFLLWISMFRASIFADKSALPFYLERIANESLSDFVLGENKLDVSPDKCLTDELQGEIGGNSIKWIADYLRADLEGKKS